MVNASPSQKKKSPKTAAASSAKNSSQPRRPSLLRRAKTLHKRKLRNKLERPHKFSKHHLKSRLINPNQRSMLETRVNNLLTKKLMTRNQPTVKWPNGYGQPKVEWVKNFAAGDQGNKGIDIAGQRGQAVVSTADGSVVYSGNALRGYGNLVIVKHNDDYLSAYAHNDKLLVNEGQSVKAGQQIATMGSSGASSVRLHFEIRYQGKSVNPKKYLP
ncbi:lipoprotein NlpD [Vibrio astriarenae]|nr:lipoprotein NlpD [Vibrio sp. C7]